MTISREIRNLAAELHIQMFVLDRLYSAGQCSIDPEPLAILEQLDPAQLLKLTQALLDHCKAD